MNLIKIKIGTALILAIALYFGFRALDGWLQVIGFNLYMETYIFISALLLWWVMKK